jgi:hypothetical protein
MALPITSRFPFNLNHHYVKQRANSIAAEDPAHPGRRLPGGFEPAAKMCNAGHDPAIPFDSYHFESSSLELIYRLLSPYKHPLLGSLALYFEPAVGDQEHGIGMENSAPEKLVRRSSRLGT